MMRAMDMAEVIRRRRAELGLSQADLAKAAGVDTRQIRRYEAGQQQPVLSVAVAIAKALGISSASSLGHQATGSTSPGTGGPAGRPPGAVSRTSGPSRSNCLVNNRFGPGLIG